MREWMRRPEIFWSTVAAACVIALLAGYVGVTVYLDREEVVAQAAAATPSVATPSPTPDAGPIVVHGTGDVNLDPRQLGIVSQSYDAPWSGVRDLFTADDLTVINLECAPSPLGAAVPHKEYNFRCPRGFDAMRRGGVDVANQANNHSQDYGATAAVDGRLRLHAHGIEGVGVGRNADEAHRPAIFQRKGKTIAVLGFGGVIPFRKWVATADRPGMADGDDIPSMVAAVKAAAAKADLVFVSIHWGAEREEKPQPGDVARAHAMIDAGADGIFGHHAHRLQPLELYKGRPIFYGLGNFVWPLGGPTAVGQVVANEDGTFTACLLRGRISGGRPTLDAPTTCPRT